MENTLWVTWWHDADIVVRSVFILLASMSLISWSVILFKAMQLNRIRKLEQGMAQDINQADSITTLQQQLTTPQPSRALLVEIDLALQKKQTQRDALTTQCNQTLREELLRLEGGLTLLASIGNSAPFIGLFGTVWGIMHALNTLGSSQAVIALETISGPVSEALVATAMGLFTAVPAVIGYNLLVRRLRYLGAISEGNAVRLINRACA